MMNKNTNQTTSDKKKRVFYYEYSKVKKNSSPIFLMTLTIQFASLVFFSIIGKLDDTADNFVSFGGIIAISSTISMCCIAIYASILLRKNLVRFYIGEQRNRLFLFPIDRKELFKMKTTSFLLAIITGYLEALVICLVIALFANALLKFDHSGIINELYLGIITMITSGLFLYAILIVSEIIAIYKQSEIATVVTALVLMLALSNFIVIGCSNFPFLTLIVALLIAFFVTTIRNVFAKKLKNMEVF